MFLSSGLPRWRAIMHLLLAEIFFQSTSAALEFVSLGKMIRVSDAERLNRYKDHYDECGQDLTEPSRLQGSILRPTSTVYPTRSKTVQNGSQFVFHAIYQSIDRNDHSKLFFKQKIRKKTRKLLNIVWTVLIHNPAGDKSVFDAFLGNFSHRKLGFLESSENSGHFWPLLTTFDHFWPLLTTFGHFWPLLVTSGHFWSLLVTFGHFWPLLTTFGHFLAYKYFRKTLWPQ